MDDIKKLQTYIHGGELLIRNEVTADSRMLQAWITHVKRYLSERFGENSIEYRALKMRTFGPTVTVSGANHDNSMECIRAIEATILELKSYLEEELKNKEEPCSSACQTTKLLNKIFIIHGHDGDIKEAVVKLLEKQGIVPIILDDQDNLNQTIIEKYENNNDVSAAIVLFTNDDIGSVKGSDVKQPRARQNVVFEAGYLMGKIGNNRVVLIAEEGNDIPSDLQGIIYFNQKYWEIEVCKELLAIGFEIDMNKLFR